MLFLLLQFNSSNKQKTTRNKLTIKIQLASHTIVYYCVVSVKIFSYSCLQLYGSSRPLCVMSLLGVVECFPVIVPLLLSDAGLQPYNTNPTFILTVCQHNYYFYQVQGICYTLQELNPIVFN